ncbi:MAG: DUF5995 family protein [Chitinophagaceae bacterium]
MKAKNIDELIVMLEQIMETSIAKKSRVGFFAALYHTVTCRVKQGILNNEFEDNARMERLDVTFANRYLEAVSNYEDNKVPTSSWDIAFQSSKKSRYLLLHHLLLGINAHINLDLGISTVEVSANPDLKAIQKDFNDINRILAELTAEFVNKIDHISPFLSLLGLHAKNYNSVFIQFAISAARDGAWVFAEELAGKTGNERPGCIDERDKKIRKLGEGIIHGSFLLRVSIFIIRLFEWRNPSRIIRELYTNQKTYFSINESKVTISQTKSTGIPDGKSKIKD